MARRGMSQPGHHQGEHRRAKHEGTPVSHAEAPMQGGQPAVPMLGFGHVWHRRRRPVPHEFVHAGYFLMLPLRALRERPSPALCRNRFGLLSFHDRDHGDGRADALAWFDELLASEGVADATGEVWLQTLPRVLGHTFKPVSFWYALRADGTLAAVLAEVNNTFGDRHCYLLAGPQVRFGAELQAAKVLHVSPFCALEGGYRFRFSVSRGAPAAGAVVAARVDHDDASGPLLETCQSGTLAALTSATRRRAFFGTPLMTLGVVLRIHWHALRLAAKRVAFHRRPPAPSTFVSR
jgi:DUF1365 family protein